MINKFNKFNSVYESALGKIVKEENAIDSKVYSNGLKIGSNIRLKPSFFSKSESIENIPSEQLDRLKVLNNTKFEKGVQHFFKVRTDNRTTVGPNVKSANDLNSNNKEFGVISVAYKDDPSYKFMLSGNDLRHIEIIDFGNDLPPILSPENPYSYPDSERGKPTPVNDTQFVGLGNSPTTRSLPTKNTKLR